MNFFLDIAYPDQASNRFELPAGLYTIGRGEACKIRLRHPEISERHALLTLRETGITIEDLHSSNGTVVDGSPIQEPTRLHADDVVGLGPCLLRVSTAVPIPPETPAAPTPPPLPGAPRAPLPAPAAEPRPPEPSPAPAPEPTDPMAAILREIKNQIHGELIQRLDLKRMTVSRIGTNELQQKARETIRSIIAEVRRNQKLPAGIDPARLEKEIYDEAMRLGPLEDFLADEAITEIMVNGPTQVFVERNGRIELTGQTFMDDESVLGVIERIVAPIGRRIDESQPYVDARLPDGSRVNAIIAPLSLIGPCITIRKFSKRALTVDDFIAFGTWTRNAAEFLRLCVLMRKNIVVAGGTGSGKTTLLNVLSNFIPPTDRIVTIEDAAELRLQQPHWLPLETRPPNLEGQGAITIGDLVKNALRMRPDRIILGEIRGAECFDLLAAMNTGHDGSMCTLHANSPRECLGRMENMILMGDIKIPKEAISRQIAESVDLIVQVQRLRDGSRRTTNVTEVIGMEGDVIVTQELFKFEYLDETDDGKILGEFRSSGLRPYTLEKARQFGFDQAYLEACL